MEFHKSAKSRARLRMALEGVAGGGKTFTALAIAAALGKRVAVIDSERGSASKYADKFEFDVLELDGNFSPAVYIEAMNAAAAAGYDVLIVDSLSHAWSGQGGALDLHDKATKRNNENSYVAWRDVTPLQNKLIDTILQHPAHVIATMRTKTAYEMEKNRAGKMAPKKVGLAPVQRAGTDFEFDVVATLDVDHNFIVTKSRCEALDGFVGNKVGKDVADILSGWLSDGVVLMEGDVAPSESPAQPQPKVEHEAVQAALDVGFEKVPFSKEDERKVKNLCMGQAKVLRDLADGGSMPKASASTEKGLAIAIFEGLGELDGKLLEQVVERIGKTDVNPDGSIVVPS